MLVVCGFIWRFGLVLWKKRTSVPRARFFLSARKFAALPSASFSERDSVGPFTRTPGPTAWIASVYPYLAALVFRFFGIYSVASAIVLLGVQCIIAAAIGFTIHAWGGHTWGAQIGFFAAWIWELSPIFFPLAGLRDLEFYRQRPSSFRGLHRHARCRGETNQRALAVACRARGGDRAHQTRFAQRHAVTFLYAALVNRSFRPCCASAALAGMLFAQRCEGPR
ncbi:MAG: hypothetical protein DMG49_00495 [Acidobacteria bacterium]|nr:MAG: hypothetical protein DMG49_00495 [Acidobacteriota bacterium]